MKLSPSTRVITLASLVVILLLMTGCQQQRRSGAALPTPTFLPEPTPLPPLPTLPVPGTEENPLVMVFVVGDAEAAAIDGERLADSFMEEEDLVIEVRLTEDYAEALDSLCGGEATVASLNSFGYIYASDLGCAELFFVEEQNGKTAEQGQIVVSVTRGIFGVIALRAQDFCRVDSASMLSWIVPSLRMRVDNIDPLNDLTSVVDAGSDAEVFRLVLNNTCDVGATSFGAELDYPEIPNIDRIRVIEELPPVPNDVIAFSPLTPPELRPVIRDLLRSFDDDLADIVEADGLVEEEDALFDGLRDLVQQSRIDLEAYAR